MLTSFAGIDAASRTVSDIIAAGIIPSALEIMDQATVRVVEQSVFASGLPVDAAAVLIIELDGLGARVESDAEHVGRICRRNGASGVRVARDENERGRIWAGRKGAFGAMARISPDVLVQDMVIPRSRLFKILPEVYRIAAHFRLRAACVFHAGDGNLHPNFYFDHRNQEEIQRVNAACTELLELCVAAGGALTGEHGVGLDKLKYMPLVFTPADLDAMARLRSIFDPTGLSNPGKVLPDRQCWAS